MTAKEIDTQQGITGAEGTRRRLTQPKLQLSPQRTPPVQKFPLTGDGCNAPAERQR